MGTLTLLPSAEDRSPEDPGARPPKSAAAFRTISEVAVVLVVAQHVLRFWESKFAQIRPLKRGGGRRYYRPEDIELLRQIRSLLYDEGYTIKGAQRLLRARRPRLTGEEPAAAPTPVVRPAPAPRPARLMQPQLLRELRALRAELVELKELVRQVRADEP